MTVVHDSRGKILERVRAATGAMASPSEVKTAHASLNRNYVRAGKMNAAERVALMIERLREYEAEVIETGPSNLSVAISAQLKASRKRRFVVPEGFPPVWMAEGFEWKIDRGLSAAEIEQCEGVLTGASCGIADSGTIVMHHSAREGRRVISLLPDWHLCVLYASQVVETLPEYFARCERAPVLATYISGPSATADIEMTRIKGVHGPRSLAVIIVK
jgi:L-lactate dehydrogenase complex protein LldG